MSSNQALALLKWLLKFTYYPRFFPGLLNIILPPLVVALWPEWLVGLVIGVKVCIFCYPLENPSLPPSDGLVLDEDCFTILLISFVDLWFPAFIDCLVVFLFSCWMVLNAPPVVFWFYWFFAPLLTNDPWFSPVFGRRVLCELRPPYRFCPLVIDIWTGLLMLRLTYGC